MLRKNISQSSSPQLPKYEGIKWLDVNLPGRAANWLDTNKSGVYQRKTRHAKARERIQGYIDSESWSWPSREIIFISDLHADADALLASLVASGGVKKTGAKDHQFKLTEKGKQALFIFGGDFFDKGPSNLRLIRVLHSLIKTRARVRLLAGNHDIRVLFGMRSVGNTNDPRNGHFFIRMGAKAVPFLKEIRDEYLQGKHTLKYIPNRKTCMLNMFPTEHWWNSFPELASWVMPKVAIDREMGKIEKKVARFEQVCERNGLSVREAYAAALKWQSLFLDESGEFHWFFKRMRLTHRKGSFLFLHAGIDDRTATMINNYGACYLNKLFRSQLMGSPFEFYYGPIANMIRTKYREVDMPLTYSGTGQAHQAGILALVHGHRNLHRGQRIALRKKILHFECDVTLDKGSREKEGLTGDGAGATLISPQGYILGISTDYDHIKVFQPGDLVKKQ